MTRATAISSSGAWAIVPVKRLADAKARLAPALSPALRRRLVLAMLHDVLAAPGAGDAHVLTPASLARDIDTPADLACLAAHPRYAFVTPRRAAPLNAGAPDFRAAAHGGGLDPDEAAALADCDDLPALMQAA